MKFKRGLNLAKSNDKVTKFITNPTVQLKICQQSDDHNKL